MVCERERKLARLGRLPNPRVQPKAQEVALEPFGGMMSAGGRDIISSGFGSANAARATGSLFPQSPSMSKPGGATSNSSSSSQRKDMAFNDTSPSSFDSASSTPPPRYRMRTDTTAAATAFWQQPTPNDGSGGGLLNEYPQEQRELFQVIAITPNETIEPATHNCETEQLSTTETTNGTGTLPTSDNYPSDSDHSDIESILSDVPSLASSQSSVFGDLNSIAFEELRRLFLSHEDLNSLYPFGLSKVGPDRFQRNLRRLLLRYGRNLSQEATSQAQFEAARFVRAMSTRLATSIKEAIMNDPELREELNGNDSRRSLALDKYLAYPYSGLEDCSGSEEENDAANEENNWTLQSLDSVKEFMVTAESFSRFHRRFEKWLKLDNRSDKEDSSSKQAPVDNDRTIRKLVPRVQPAEDMSNKMRGVPLSQVDSAGPAALAGRDSALTTDQAFAFMWLDRAHCLINRLESLVSDFLQPQVGPGRARVSWTCRCGKRLRLEVPAIFEAEAIQFAKEAAGSSGDGVVSTRGPDARGSSPARSNAPGASTRNSSSESESDDSSPAPSISQNSSTRDISSPCTPGSPPSTVPSLQGGTPMPFIPAGTKQYLLLCANNRIRRIGLENVDVTDVQSDEEIFSRLQSAYCKLRGGRRRNPFVVPKRMQYIKFQLLHLKKSKECVGYYQINSVPTIKEILNQEYTFDLPKFGPLPIPPDLFMHAFLDPGDHMGDMAVRLLPKKLGETLRWDARLHDAFNLPIGWGFLIVEELNWRLITLIVLGAVIFISVGTLLWSVLQEDVQGGVGIGQYLIAALAVLVSAYLLGHGPVCDGL